MAVAASVAVAAVAVAPQTSYHQSDNLPHLEGVAAWGMAWILAKSGMGQNMKEHVEAYGASTLGTPG